MLFSQYQDLIKAVKVGKRLPTAVYLHRDALADLPAALATLATRISAALSLTPDDFDIVKFATQDFRLSFLSYPTFMEEPYPSLHKSWTVDLETKSHRTASYADSDNPPILHRRELFFTLGDPRREVFAKYTEEGEAIGAYANGRGIGTRRGWEAALRRLGHRIGRDDHLEKLLLQSEQGSELGPDKITIARHKTALSRADLSAPMFTLASAGFLSGQYSVLDYGCGRGDDLRALIADGIECSGWDPVFLPDEEPVTADIVNLGYVINVIEDRDERTATLRRAFDLSARVLAVSAMLGNDDVFEKFQPYKDGVVTKAGTFQKYFFQSELREYIESTLKHDAVAAGPGLFLVFRDNELQQQYLVNKQRTAIDARSVSRRIGASRRGQVPKAKIAANKALLDDLWSTVLELGRPPTADEFDQAEAAQGAFGSLSKAIQACETVFDVEGYEGAENIRKNDLLVYLALEHFSKRRPYRRMPASLRRDIAYHFGKYSDGRLLAQTVLYSVSDIEMINAACVEAHAGLPASLLEPGEGLTFHKEHLNRCPPALRVYVGCALQLYGDLITIDLIKVHIQSGKVTLLGFDDFAGKAVPRLQERIKIKMAEQDIDFFDYVLGFEPPPLLNKSIFLDPNSDAYNVQLRFDDQLRETIGDAVDEPYIKATRLRELLRSAKVRVNGYRLDKVDLQ